MSGEGRKFFDKILASRRPADTIRFGLEEDEDPRDVEFALLIDGKKNNVAFTDVSHQDIQALPPYLRVVSPMVRFSKLPFRLLCRRYGADLAYTPMIIAEGFNASEYSRDSDFTTNPMDAPLSVQFATNSPVELQKAVIRTRGFVNSVNLNCGCPQKWAMKKCIGAHLSSKPQLVKELVSAAKNAADVPVSIKIRIHEHGVRATVDLVQQAEKAGVAYITMHGRSAAGNGLPVDLDSIKVVKEHATVPIVANGDIFTPADIVRVVRETNVDGVMCARGLLDNPAMFADRFSCPLQLSQEYLQLALQFGGTVRIHKGHLGHMLHRGLTPDERKEFSMLTSMCGIVDFFTDREWWPLSGPHNLDVQSQESKPMCNDTADVT